MCSGYVLKIASAFVFVAIFLFVVGSSKVLNVKSVRLTIKGFLFIFFSVERIKVRDCDDFGSCLERVCVRRCSRS